MKKISILLLLVCFVLCTKAQNIFPSTGSAGIGTITPNASSILEMKSTTKGMLAPRMTKAQRDAIATPATGLLIYQTNSTPGFYYYSGTAWTAVTSTGANTSLSNLSLRTAVNTNLLPDSNNLRNLGNATTGWRNIFASGSIFLGGARALYTDGTNLFAGKGAGSNNSTGYGNTATGTFALHFNTAGIENTATGDSALFNNSNGSDNSATGYYALFNNTTGFLNTANGWHALGANTTGQQNTATGLGALYTNSTGSYNIADGYDALYSNTTADNNTAVGSDALPENTTGGSNTAIGSLALFYNVIGNNNTAIGFNAGTFSSLTNTTALGYNSQTTADNQVRIGSNTVISIGGYANWTNISDGRVKKNIKQNVPGLSFINKLQPVTYNLDLNAADVIVQRPMMKDKDGKIIQPSEDEIQTRKQKEQIVYTGFIAQDVEKAAKSLSYDFSGVDAAKNSKDLYGLRYSDFVAPLVKAVQELSEQHDELSKQTEENQKQIDALKTMIISGNKINAVATTNDKQQTVNLSLASLEQNTPNPFSNTTTINYTLPQKFLSAQIIITDKNGRVLKQVAVSGYGKGVLNIDVATLSSGVYHYSLYVDGKVVDSKQMVSIK